MRKLNLPPEPGELDSLSAGDEVLLSGDALTLRDAALRRVADLLEKGEKPPFDLEGQLIFHAGPSPPSAGRPCGAIGPTTSARMGRFLPLLFDLGVRVTLGKGPHTGRAVDLHKKYGAVYLVAAGGIAALYGGMVKGIEPVAWEELGPEAVYRVSLEDFPVVVAVDTGGRDYLAEQYLMFGSGSGNI